MPRANRYRIDGQVWHITQRCHRKRYRRIAEDDGTSVLRDGADEYGTIPGSKWAA